MTAFHVGQKVVCIDDSIGLDGSAAPIEEGRIYTIRGVTKGHSVRGEGIGLLFEEIPPLPAFPKGYIHSRFRPVVERKTDISIFTDMLNKTRTGVPA